VFAADHDFRVMGLRIEHRSRIYRTFWESHLQRCRTFLNRQLPRRFRDISILGAGRLLDIDTAALAARCSCLRLVDFDRGCERRWTETAREHPDTHFLFHFVDLTGVLWTWTNRLRRCGSPGQLVELLRSLAAEVMLDPPIPRSEIVVSLNLLSQIPLYWRDRVESFADRQGWRSVDWGAELLGSMGRLQQHHLRGLCESQAAVLAILTDIDFGADAGPAVLSNVDYRSITGYTQQAEDSWEWTVVPSGPEDPCGQIHLVQAMIFVKDSGKPRRG
jgi:hypothetical protein